MNYMIHSLVGEKEQEKTYLNTVSTTKQKNKTKQNKTKQNKTKQNKQIKNKRWISLKLNCLQQGSSPNVPYLQESNEF